MPVVPWVKKHGLFDAKVLAAHCVHVDDGEIRALKNANAGVAHNPSSNLKLGAGVAPVARMLELGVNVGIGTDGAASNNDLDMFEETRLAALLAKGTSGDPTAIPARTALAMATRIGAAAMHMDHLTGSLEPGKRADLIVLDLDRLHNVPAFGHDANGIYSQIVYASKSTDVVDVMCNGRWLMRDRALLTLDERELREAARGEASRVDAFLVEPRSQRAAEARRGRRRRRAGELRSPGQGAGAVGRTGAGGDRRRAGHRRPIEPLPPVRHLLVVRGSGAGMAALSRGRVPRRGGRRDRRARAAHADRPDARGSLRRRAALALALLRAGDALRALLSRVLPARRPSGSSRRIGAAGWSPSAASSSTCTSIG